MPPEVIRSYTLKSVWQWSTQMLIFRQFASMDSIKEVVNVSSEGKIISVTFGKPMYCRVELVK